MNLTVIEINLGSQICVEIKRIFFPEVPWVECYLSVGDKFAELKQRMMKFSPMEDNIALLQELVKYSQQDLIEVFETPELRPDNGK